MKILIHFDTPYLLPCGQTIQSGEVKWMEVKMGQMKQINIVPQTHLYDEHNTDEVLLDVTGLDYSIHFIP